jgi:hypothetical protein
MAISLEHARAQEEMMRRHHWEEQHRQMMNANAYYDMNREMFVIPREQAAGKRVPNPTPPRAASDPLAFMDNQANKVLLTQGEM